MNADKTIHIAAAIIMDTQLRILLVRKRDTRYFMQPGGKIEAAEQSINALIRELDEELQIKVSEKGCTLHRSVHRHCRKRTGFQTFR